jgi:Cytochrome c
MRFFPIVRRVLAGMLVCALPALPALTAVGDETADLAARYDIARGKIVYEKVGICLQCHGWDGNGRGRNPRAPGPAALLRGSELDFDTMRYVIACGRPGTAMPYHDRMAYRDDRCGMLLKDFAEGEAPERGKTMPDKDLDNLVAYIQTTIVGAGKTTLAQCEAFYHPGHPNCRGLK